MKFILDLNRAQRGDELQSHLASGNDVIIIDDFVVESFKNADPYYSLFMNFSTLREFPQSVFYSRKRGELFTVELQSGRPVRTDEIIDDENTKTLRSLLPLSRGQLERKLSLHSQEAMRLIDFNDEISEQFILELVKKHKELDIKKYRKDPRLLQAHIAETSLMLTEQCLEEKCEKEFDIEEFRKRPSAIFLFYYSLLWKNAKWLIDRGFEEAPIKKICNDGFDLKYVETSCFFDGLLTGEKWLKECRESILAFYNK